MSKIFYREVRRLAYLRLICDIIAKEKSSEIILACERFIDEAKKLNRQLESYRRNTGKVEKISVARNHFAVAEMLKLVQIEGEFLKSTNEGAFFACLPRNEDNPFFLTTEEKISFFERMFPMRLFENIEYAGLPELRKLLILFDEDCLGFKEIRDRLRGDIQGPHVDHIVKSSVEWLVDLDLLISTRKRKGKFEKTKIGKNIRNELLRPSYTAPQSILLKLYAESFLGKVEIQSEIDDEMLMSSFDEALEKTRKYAASEISKELFSALPIIRYTRLILLTKHMIILSLDQLLILMRALLPKKGITLKWEPLYEGGYIKI